LAHPSRQIFIEIFSTLKTNKEITAKKQLLILKCIDTTLTISHSTIHFASDTHKLIFLHRSTYQSSYIT